MHHIRRPRLRDRRPAGHPAHPGAGVIAEYEKAKIAERYRRGKLFRARAGEITTWKTAYGYVESPAAQPPGRLT